MARATLDLIPLRSRPSGRVNDGGAITKRCQLVKLGKHKMKTETSQYEQQAEAFLQRFGITFRATLKDSKPAPWRDDENIASGSGHHYRVTLGRSIDPFDQSTGREYPKRLTFDFWGSVADAKNASRNVPGVRLDGKTGQYIPQVNGKDVSPTSFDEGRALEIAAQASLPHVTAYDVLACVSGDVNCPETFEDFCSEYGYDKDSIKALQLFRRCAAFGKRLREFFTAEEIEALQEIQ